LIHVAMFDCCSPLSLDAHAPQDLPIGELEVQHPRQNEFLRALARPQAARKTDASAEAEHGPAPTSIAALAAEPTADLVSLQSMDLNSLSVLFGADLADASATMPPVALAETVVSAVAKRSKPDLAGKWETREIEGIEALLTLAGVGSIGLKAAMVLSKSVVPKELIEVEDNGKRFKFGYFTPAGVVTIDIVADGQEFDLNFGVASAKCKAFWDGDTFVISMVAASKMFKLSDIVAESRRTRDGEKMIEHIKLIRGGKEATVTRTWTQSHW